MCQGRSLQVPFSSPRHTLLQPYLSRASIKAMHLRHQHPCAAGFSAWEVLPQREGSLNLSFIYLLLPHLLLTQSHSLIRLCKRALNGTIFYSILPDSVHFSLLWHGQCNIVLRMTWWRHGPYELTCLIADSIASHGNVRRQGLVRGCGLLEDMPWGFQATQPLAWALYSQVNNT